MVSDLVRRQLTAVKKIVYGAHAWGLSDIVILVALVSVSGFRYYVGTDFWIYKSVYSQLDPTDWPASIARAPHEIGYTAFSLLVKSYFESPQALVWATAIATVVPTYIAIKRLSANRALSVFLYLASGIYFFGFNQIRQSIALGLTLLAYSYFKSSKAKYILLMALAVSFHVSALIVPVTQIATARWRATPARALILAVGVGALGMAMASLSELASSFNERYGGYIEHSDTAGFGTILLAAVRLVVVVWGLWSIRSGEPSRDVHRYIMYLTVSVGLVLLGYISVPVARLETYFSAYLILLVPSLVSRSKVPRLVTWAVVLVGFAHLVIHVSTFNGVLPYQTQDGFYAP